MCHALFWGDGMANKTDSCPHRAYMQNYTTYHSPLVGPFAVTLPHDVSSAQCVTEYS